MNRMPNWIDEIHIAHRGYFNDTYPENSLGAFQRAIEHGYGIELDVQMLKDGTLVVFHDEHLKRMTGFDGLLTDCDYQSVHQLKLLDSSEGIPTFKEFLELVDGRVPLMIEFKNETRNNSLEKEGYEILKSYKGPYIMQSFNPISVLWFKRHAPEVIRGQLSCRHKNSKLNSFSRFVIRNVMTNIVTKPDFVIYDINALDTFIIKWLKFFKKPLYGYTAKSLDAYRVAVKQNVKPVFEGFDPDDL